MGPYVNKVGSSSLACRYLHLGASTLLSTTALGNCLGGPDEAAEAVEARRRRPRPHERVPPLMFAEEVRLREITRGGMSTSCPELGRHLLPTRRIIRAPAVTGMRRLITAPAVTGLRSLSYSAGSPLRGACNRKTCVSFTANNTSRAGLDAEQAGSSHPSQSS